MKSIRLIGSFFLIIGIFLNSEISYGKEKLVVAFSILEPWKMIYGKSYEGAYAELSREIAKGMGMEIQFKKCPLKRCLIMLKYGKVDMVVGIRDTVERKKYIHFLKTPYRMSSAKVFYLKKGMGQQVQKYEDLYKLRIIGTKLGAKYFSRFDHDLRLKTNLVKDNKQNFLMLNLGRVDAVVIAEDQGEFLISTLDLRNKVEKAPYFHKDDTPRYVGISKQSKYIKKLEKFEGVMSQISDSGKLEEIIVEQYFKRFDIPEGELKWK